MKSEDLLKYIGGIDEKFVDELTDDKVVSIHAARRKRSRWLTAAACFAVIFLCAAVLMGVGTDVGRGQLVLSDVTSDISMASGTFVMIDVNPSIQLEINDRGIVISAEAMNDDAEPIVLELQLEGMSCEDAIVKTVTAMQDKEFITNLKNSMLVTVVDSDETKADELRNQIIEIIQTLDANTSYDFSILSQIFTDVSEYAELAESHNMSAGRAALIDAICKACEDYSFDELSDCNIQTINQLLEYIDVPEFVKRIGTAAATVPAELRDKLMLEDLSQDELISFTLAVSDFYNKLCESYDEADVANHIGYVFDIVCQQTDDGSMRWALLAENLSNELQSCGAIIHLGDRTVIDWYADSSLEDIVDFFDDIT